MTTNELTFFTSFLIFILALLFFDLGLFNRKSHSLKFKEAVIWTIIWVCFALGFYVFLRFFGDEIHGIKNIEELKQITQSYQHSINIDNLNFNDAISIYNNNLSLEFITGYLIEYALSIDNIFVIIMIFISFGVESKYYKRVLFWGIFGAIIMRFIFIFVSSALINQFAWILYVFGALLVFTGIKMFIDRNKKSEVNTEKHPVVRFASKYFNVSKQFDGHKFFTKIDGKKVVTPLFIVLLVVEFSDVIFAVDSVPAIFSITKDPYIVFFSNIFAIIGLRSLFFLIINIIDKFRFLKIGLSVLLVFIGAKMFVHSYLKLIGFTTAHSLIVVLLILSTSIILSVVIPVKNKAKN